MNKKDGFTLVELLAVIALLGMLMGIVMFQASHTLKKANQEYYKTQENMILLSAKDYFSDYRSKLPKNIGEDVSISLATLEEELYIDPVVDVNQKLCDSIRSVIHVKKKKDQEYDYQVYLVCQEGGYQTEIE